MTQKSEIERLIKAHATNETICEYLGVSNSWVCRVRREVRAEVNKNPVGNYIKKNYYDKKPTSTLYKPAKQTCLKCQNEFMAWDKKANHICPQCTAYQSEDEFSPTDGRWKRARAAQ